MKTLNYVKILLLCVFTIGLASCGDDVYYTMQNSDDKLCGKTWIEEYQTENKDGVEVLCSHQLKFAKADNSGQEASPVPMKRLHVLLLGNGWISLWRG